MQDIHYNYVKNKCGDKTQILMTDTKSLMYKIEAENIYEDVKSILASVIIQKIQNITMVQIT